MDKLQYVFYVSKKQGKKTGSDWAILAFFIKVIHMLYSLKCFYKGLLYNIK